MIKKILFVLLVIFTLFHRKIYGNSIVESTSEMLDISSYLEEAEKYTEEVFEGIDFSEMLTLAIEGDIDESNIFNKILRNVGKELKDQINIVSSIIIIIVIHSILKSINDGLENGGIGQITYFVQYILIVTLIMTSFTGVISLVRDAISNLVGFSYSLIPLLLSLMIITNNAITVTSVQPILLLMITFIGNFISSFLLPMVLVGTSLGIISNISDKIQIDKLAKTFKSSVVWILGIVLTIFTGVLSMETSLTNGVDSLVAKTTKSVITTAVPVVGKILSDTAETILGSGIILKNAVGIIGVIVIMGICAIPIIRLGILTIIYHLMSALCQPIADKKILNIIEQMRDTFKVLLGMVCSVSVMLIIGVTIVIKISNI